MLWVFEFIATKQDGLLFMISCHLEISESIKSHLISYWPSLQIKKIRQGKGYKVSRPTLY